MKAAEMHSIEAEHAVLGALLLDNAALDRLSGLRSEDFYTHDHREVFRASVALIAGNRPADSVTVWEALGGSKGTIALEYLSTLAMSTPSAANAAHYARIVRDHAIRRDLLVAISQTAADLQQGGDVHATVDAAQAAFLRVTEARAGQEPHAIGELMHSVVEILDRRYSNPNDVSLRGVATGLRDLDRRMSGLRPGEMFIVAARPGMGKTALGLNVAANVAMSGEASGAVLFVSLEMGAHELAERCLALAGGAPYAGILSGEMNDKEWNGITEGVKRLAERKLFIDDTGGLDLGRLATKARSIKRRHGLALLVVDYIGLMRSGANSSRENRTQEIGAISRGLKALAKELQTPVMVLAQLNRQNEARPDKRPQLSDLRDSGDIEQDADAVLLCHRPSYYDAAFKPSELMEVHIAKMRRGKTGIVPLAFDGDTQQVTTFTGTWPMEAPSPRRQQSRGFD
ncbi:replicative DNA helicase [Cupriavidus basilensis]